MWKDSTKRFHSCVDLVARSGSWAIALDDKPIKTAEGELLIPFAPLANAIADEWRDVGPLLRREALPLTGLAIQAIGTVAKEPEQIQDELVRYGQSDLVCYRVPQPQQLVLEQERAYSPLLAWLNEQHGVSLAVTSELTPLRQDPAALARLRAAIAQLEPFVLTGLVAATHVLGSIVLGFAMIQGRVDASSAFELSRLDEAFQIARWGSDEEASARAEGCRRELLSAARFAQLSRHEPTL